MPIRPIAGTKLDYFLIMFDENGAERPEEDMGMLSDAVRKRLNDRSAPVTDVFVMAHGWMGDATSAQEQFDRWTAAMLSVNEDIGKMNARKQGFAPLVIGLHWPSLPWGVEDAPAAGTAVLSTDSDNSADIAAIASQLADTDKARKAIAEIFAFADRARSAVLTPDIVDAYAVVFHESQLRVGSLRGRPGSDQEAFDAPSIVEQARQQSNPGGAGQQVLSSGIAATIKDAILAPLRQLSFWKMKDRARVFGESGAHALLGDLQAAAPDAAFHLMGHSFGCIVVSAMVAGPEGANASPLARPVDSLFLVQGALSLWSYATDIPYAPGKLGYFQRILSEGRVRGPLLTTRSTHDSAVGRFYPLGARLKGQVLLGETYPEYGGIGAFGIRGSAGAQDMVMQTSDFIYVFENGCIYNLDASDVIKNGDGPAGAHSDIAHPEVAHAFWGAVLTMKGTVASAEPAPVTAGGAGAIPPASAQPPAAGAAAAPVPKRKPGLLDIDVLPREVGTAAKITNLGQDPAHRGVRILGIDTAADAPATRGSAPELPPLAERWINADFEGIDPAEPLVKGNWYTLAFDIDTVRKISAQATALAEEGVFAPGVNEVVLTVQVDTQDFDLSGRTSQMRLPRVGKAHTKARFDVSPLKDGPCTMKATILKDGNFIQQMDLSFNIGQPRPEQPDEVPSRGRAFGSAGLLESRDLGLLIKPSDGGYDCTVWGAVAASAHLPITPAYLDDAIRVARSQLMQVVMQRDGAGNYPFQSDEPISKESTALALRTMSFAGALLLQRLFYAPGAGLDSKAVGDVLRRLAGERTSRLKLQIIAESLPVPWGLLYVGDVSDPTKLDWDNFLGMRHVIEQIPLQNPMRVTDRRISTHPVLAVSVNLNDDIDAQMDCDFVKQQRAYWCPTERIKVISRSTSQELVAALNDVNNTDQILYFYGHAGSNGLTDPGGPGRSSLALTNSAVTLDELTLTAPATVQLGGNPLVFINACESAEMSPMFYDGFAPYFMSKGARGVIGTECKTPAYFAMLWAQQFFDIFLKGEPLGTAFLDLRRKFLLEQGNPLGLLYAVHCNADTTVDPAI
ncbi:CHAT domain protein [Caballeronia udeis]|uniref:CHAT domain protein n=1 Tax=Caballeronia udeis TaxID=1232866 RepID=A0A158JIA5_9BURK|nr:CHAT domain-containing protein [Caballeronia udeis]SAL68161.1 CHAT domain protein [Caballeronia udeis]